MNALIAGNMLALTIVKFCENRCGFHNTVDTLYSESGKTVHYMEFLHYMVKFHYIVKIFDHFSSRFTI